ncbi:hypothetical protein [Methylobacterium sp. A54F]
MSRSTSCSEQAFSVVADMEDDMRSLRRWANVLCHLGGGASMLEPTTIHVIGEALLDVAMRAEAQWEEAFRLTHPKNRENRSCASS